jgi:hypothetical protein
MKMAVATEPATRAIPATFTSCLVGVRSVSWRTVVRSSAGKHGVRNFPADL